MVAIGLFAGLLILNKLATRSRLKLKFLADYSLAIFLGGLLCSRLFYIIHNYPIYFSELSSTNLIQLFSVWDKGLSVWGGIIGILATLTYFSQKNKEDTLKWLDVTSVAILAGLTFGHIGAFLDGRNFGRETTLPWGVIIETSLYTVPIHPTQIYAAIYCGLLAIILFQLFSHKISKKAGTISIIALGSYSFLRFLEEFLRGDESNIFLGLREAQIYALLGLIISGILFYVHNLKTKNTTSAPII